MVRRTSARISHKLLVMSGKGGVGKSKVLSLRFLPHRFHADSGVDREYGAFCLPLLRPAR